MTNVIGVPPRLAVMALWTGRDFKWVFENLDVNSQPEDFPAGDLFFELETSEGPTRWEFLISGSTATLKVESTDADLIPGGTEWQLVFLPSGETAGGDPIAYGIVNRVG